MSLPRARCPWCSTVQAVRGAPGGNGTLDLYPYHLPDGRRANACTPGYCKGSRAGVNRDEYEEADPHGT